MSILDFFIGFTLMNAMPHFVLGVWKRHMLSGLGMSPRANILYGLLNFSVSIGLFLYGYGVNGLATHGVYAGGLFILLMYFLTAKFFEGLFSTRNR